MERQDTQLNMKLSCLLIEWLDSLIQKCFYGTITLYFQNGKIVHLEKTESLKVENLKQ